MAKKKKELVAGRKRLTRVERDLRDNQAILALNATTLRREVLARLLNPGKNINYECGYPDTIVISDYKNMYDREGLAARVVGILPDESWTFLPAIYETEKSDETKFEKAWKNLEKEKHLFHYLQRIDVLSGIGRFGVLLFGISDGEELNEPVEGIDLKTGEKSGSKIYELLYLRPFDESVVKVKMTEPDITSPRYGYPVLYTIDFEEAGEKGTLQKKEVHWTRILHIADGRTTSEIYGTPRQKPVYNRLLDVRKVLSASGEMFWKGGFPGYAFEIDPELSGEFTDAQKVTLREEFENYSQGLQRYLAIAGVKTKSLIPQVADPKGHIEAQVKMIAISLGIPYRIFIGTEEARLASAQDIETWNKRVAKRQEGYVTPMLIRPLVDKLTIYGMLPEIEEYFIDWPDLNIPSDKDKAEVAKIKTEAMSKYVQAGVDTLIAPKEFLMMILGMTEDEAKAIEDAVMKYVETKSEGEGGEVEEEIEEE